MPEIKISPDQSDALGELVNLGMGKAASVISEMLNEKVSLSAPEIKIIEYSQFQSSIGEFANLISVVQMKFFGPFSGISTIVFPPESATNLVTALMGEDVSSEEIDCMRYNTLNELGNILLNSVVGNLTNMLHERVNFGVPEYLEGETTPTLKRLNLSPTDPCLTARTRFIVRDLEIKGDIILVFTLDSMQTLLKSLDKLLADV